MQAGSQGFESPCLQSSLASQEENEDCRAVALAKADSLNLPRQRSELRLGKPVRLITLRLVRGERRLSRRSVGEGGLFELATSTQRATTRQAKPRMNSFCYVYILQSTVDAERFYTGLTDDLRDRLKAHNAGRIRHTATWRPWRLKTYVAVSNRTRAAKLERYFKSSSGRAFIKKHL